MDWYLRLGENLVESAAMNALEPWFAHAWGLQLLGLVPALAVVALLAGRRRGRSLLQLGGYAVLAAVLSLGRWRRFIGGLSVLLGLTLLIVAIAGPQWGADAEAATAPGRDVVAVLDLSQSMLAQDVLGRSSPNRLGRARDALLDLANAMQRRGGHRLALVVFAARAHVVCPLTHDYDHFRETLEQLTPGDPFLEIGPLATSVSGTRIGAGLAEAVRLHDPRFQGHQDIVLLSDGDDPASDGEWNKGAALAAKDSIPVTAVGIGDPEHASPIILPTGGRLRHRGQEVTTRLHEKPLQEIARVTSGLYIPAQTQALPLGELVQQRIEAQTAHQEIDESLPMYQPRYPWFIGGALICLALAMSLGEK
jgi:Ca-activated chloride channel family protein